MDSILKLLLVARKAKRKNAELSIEHEHIYDFSAFNILNNNKDWAWSHECSKTDWIQKLYKVDCSEKILKKIFNHHISKVCFYSEFYQYAEFLIKRYKKGEKRRVLF